MKYDGKNIDSLIIEEIAREGSYSSSHEKYIREILTLKDYPWNQKRINFLKRATEVSLRLMLEETRKKKIGFPEWQKKFQETWNLLTEFPARKPYQEKEVRKVSDFFWVALNSKEIEFKESDIVWLKKNVPDFKPGT
jgi:hypothetical protein